MSDGMGLRPLADARGLLYGGAISPQPLAEIPEYAAIVERDFNCLVAENIMKFSYLQPEPGRFEFAAADRLLDYARDHNMAMRGHTFVWHNQLPDWVRELAKTPDVAERIMRDHIAAVGAHFAGRVFCWDVVNEAIEDKHYGYRAERSPWFQSLGESYVEMAFRAAHEADPDALLFYNDYDLEWVDAKFESCYRLVSDLLDRDVPIHGVGFQYHTRAMDAPHPDAVLEKFERINALGLTVHITELDVKLPTRATEEDFAREDAVYRGIFETALRAPDCPCVMLWGVSDAHSWIPSFTKGEYDHPLLYDHALQPKSAYAVVREVLAG